MNSIACAGVAHSELGMPERALAFLEEAVQGARRKHLVLLMSLAGVDLAELYRALGMPERAKELLIEIDQLVQDALPAWRLLRSVLPVTSAAKERKDHKETVFLRSLRSFAAINVPCVSPVV